MMTIDRVTGMQLLDRPQITTDTVEWTGFFDCGTSAERDIRVLQLQGLMAKGGVVAVTVSETPRMNGFYRLVDMAVEPWDERDPVVRWSVSMTPLGVESAVGIVEQVGTSSLRVNDDGVTGTYRSSFVPVGAEWRTAIGGELTMPTPDGDMLQVWDTPYVGSLVESARMAPELRAVGRCLIEWTADGGVTWFPVEGRRLPAGSTEQSIRWSNGVVRFSTVGPSMTIQVWNGTVWQTVPGTFRCTDTAGQASIHPGSTPKILRNDDEGIALQFSGALNMLLTVSLLRGHRHVECRFRFARTAGPVDFDLDAVSAGTSANIPGGIRRSTAVSGLRWVILSTEAAGNKSSGQIRDVSPVQPWTDFAFGAALEADHEWISRLYFSQQSNTEFVT